MKVVSSWSLETVDLLIQFIVEGSLSKNTKN